MPTESGSTSAADFIPSNLTLPKLREAASGCRGCGLWRDATQTVFGEGIGEADVMFVGEVPGDREDLAGKPFVGPAGKLFDQVLEEVGIDRNEVYVTNVVKHFKFTRRGKRRIHKRPSAEEITACRPWLDAELAVVNPEVLVCLGATAAQALIGRRSGSPVSEGSSWALTWRRPSWPRSIPPRSSEPPTRQPETRRCGFL